MNTSYTTRTAPAEDGQVDLSIRKNRNLEFGKRVYKAIVDQGITQSELARRAGLGRDSVSQYVRGRSVPSPLNLNKLADALGMEAEDLFPDYAAGAYDSEELSQQISAVPGDTTHMWVRVNMKLPTEKALQILNIINQK